MDKLQSVVVQDLSYQMPIFKGKAVGHADAKVNILKEIQDTPKYGIKYPGIQLTDCDWHLRDSYPRKYWPHAFEAISPCMTKTGEEMDFDSWEIGAYWYQWYEQGDYHDWHIHGQSMFVGVYYVLLSINSPCVSFNWRGKKESFDVEEGDVVIFPSYLRHRASVNNTSDTKVILSFNIDYK